MKLSERMLLIARDKETELEITVAMEVYANEVVQLESQNAELLEALQEIAYGSYHYADDITAEFERRRQIATEAIRKAKEKRDD